MSALTQQRNTPQLGDPISPILDTIDAPVKAGSTLWVGGMCAVDSSGYFVDPTAVPGLIVAGRVEPMQNFPTTFNNSAGASGAITAKARQGVFRFANGGGGDAIAVANRYQLCYLMDDQTVGLTDGGATPRSVAGIIIDLDTSGVYVLVCAAVTAAIMAAAGPGSAVGGVVPVEQISANGALSTTIETSILAVSGTMAFTLAVGTRVGQTKRVYCKSAAATPSGVVTVTGLSDSHNTITFSAVGQFVLLKFDGTKWNPVELNGAVIA